MSSADRFLMVMWDGGGSVPPLLGVAEKLRTAGHQVSILGEQSMHAEVAAAGFQLFCYQYAPNRPDRRPESDPYPDWNGQSPFQVLKRLLFEFAGDYAKDVRELCRKYPFDHILIDGFLLGAMIGAESAGKNFSVLWPAIDLVPHPGRPPDGLGLSPGRNIWSKTRNRALNRVFVKILSSGIKPLNATRAQYDLPLLDHPFDQYRQADKVLILSSRYFDYPTQLPANTCYVGPIIKDPSWSEAATINEQGLFILVSLGSTFQAQRALYEKLMDVLSELPIPSIVTLGNVFEPEAFKSYPNIRILKSGAHGEILPHCGCVIHHGGHGITMKSILAGLPQLVIPLGRDQHGNAARVVYHGIGLKAKPKTAQKKLLKKIKTLLSDEQFSKSAQSLAVKIREEMAEDLVVKYLDPGR